MSIHERLRAREDVDDDDIPEIIGRAEALQVESQELGFSGRYSIETAPVLDWQGLPTGERFLLHAADVKCTVPGIERPEEFFLGVSGEELSLFYLGQFRELGTAPSQGHVFRRE